MSYDKNVNAEKMLEQIDACRPGSRDVELPELRELASRLAISRAERRLYDRVQQLDGTLEQAIGDVPLPPGLADRLLGSLASARATPIGAHTADENEAALQGQGASLAVSPQPVAHQASNEHKTFQSSRLLRRRGWLWTSIAMATAASLLGIAWFGNRPAGLSAESLMEEASLFYAERQQGESWFVDQHRPPPHLPFSHDVLEVPRTRWSQVADFLDRKDWNAVAYEMHFRSATATLYVAQAPAAIANLPNAPLATPRWSTANRVVSAWQDGSLLYVLVVEGDERTYRSFIKPKSMA